jgi:hypothetical protein
MDDHIQSPTSATALLARSIANLDLERLPERLDDSQLAMVRQIAEAPLPSLPPCDERHFMQCLRVMIAVLPRQASDDLTGEIFVGAYQRQLAYWPADAITYMMDQATRQCQWFPTIADCLEILSGWRRADADTLRKGRAEGLYRREVNARRPPESHKAPVTDWATPSEIDRIKREAATRFKSNRHD